MTASKVRPGLPVFLLLAALAVQGIWTIADKSPTVDEFAHHVPSGYTHLVTGDFRMNPAAPPLPRLLSAAPLFLMGVRAPLDDVSWKEADSPNFARKFFYGQPVSPDLMIFWARVPILLLSLVFAFFVWVWAAALFGAVGGLAALALFVFCPDVVAHSSLATSDLAVAFFFYMTIWRFWKYLKKPGAKNCVITAVMAGCAMLSKFSAVLIFPLLFLLAALTGGWKKLSVKSVALFLAVVLVSIWAGYFFELKPVLKSTPDPAKKAAFLREKGGEGLVRFAQTVPLPLTTFTSAFAGMMMTRARGTNAYFMGEWSEAKKSWWQYYFTAFGIKNTVPFLLLLLLSLASLAKLPGGRALKVFLLLPAAVFFAVTLRDKAQAGIRYFLPVYPMLFILCGGFAAAFWPKGKGFRALVAVLLAWHAVEAARIAPDALAYFNELAGGPDKGYLYLRDSNVDWGQDLEGLARWARKEKVDEIVVATHSILDLQKFYGIRWRLMTAEDSQNPPHARVYAVGLHGIDSVIWKDRYKPSAIIGHSIWVYDLRNEDLPI